MPTTIRNVNSRKNSRGIASSSRSMGRASQREAASENVMKPSALRTRTSVCSSSPPPPPAKARTTAMAMSSTMRMARMRSVSSSASRRKSISPLTATADEET
jgi:hypothetical protein